MTPFRYLSVCSGIEAATQAKPSNWEPLGFAEIDPFCCALLQHYYPNVRNHHDFTSIRRRHFSRLGTALPNVLCGGTPCQSFSVAGKRAGLDDPRGNLAVEFALLARRLRTEWIVWENVPGMLSSWSDGPEEGWEQSDFDYFLSLLGQCGYGCAFGILNAQYFGVPQRRNRIVVVGYSRNVGRPASEVSLQDLRRFSAISAGVLFDLESLQGDFKTRTRKKKASPAGASEDSFAGRFWGQIAEIFESGEVPSGEVAGTLGGGGRRGWAPDTDRMTFIPDVSYARNGKHGTRIDAESETFVADTCPTLDASYGRLHGQDQHIDSGAEMLVSHSLRASGFDASEDGTGRGTPLIASTLSGQQNCSHDGQLGTPVVCSIGLGSDPISSVDLAQPVTGRNGDAGTIAFGCKDGVGPSPSEELSPTLRRMGNSQGHQNGGGQVAAVTKLGVRRLTPFECERLQGFPPDYTLIPYRGKLAADGPRYAALGNSWAVPKFRWVFGRIEQMRKILEEVDGQ